MATNDCVAHVDLLDRQSIERRAAAFQGTSELVREVVDYGTHLVVRCMSTILEPRLADGIVLGQLVPEVLALLDSMADLGRAAHHSPMRLVMRTLFETQLYARWILEDASDNRAMAYQAYGLYRDMIWARKLLPGTRESEAFHALLSDVEKPFYNDPEAAARILNWVRLERERIPALDRLVALAEADEQRRLWWFRLAQEKGVWVLRDLAEALGQLGRYEVIWRLGSSAVHASNTTERFIRELGHNDSLTIAWKPLRMVECVNDWAIAIPIVSDLYRALLGSYRPQELVERYPSVWRGWSKRHKEIPQLHVEYDTRGGA